MVTPLDPNLLLNLFQSRAGQTAAGAGAGATAAKKKTIPTAPWNQPAAAAITNEAVKAALSGRRFVSEGATRLDVPGASADYRKLFALYQGLGALMGVAEQSTAKNLAVADRTRINQAFDRGLKEILGYVDTLQLDQVRVIQGEVSTSAASALGVPKAKTEYVTRPLASGSSDTAAEAFQGAVQFTVTVKRSGQTFNVPIDLAGMGATTRSVGNVAAYVNQQLEAAGIESRFASQRIPGGPKTTTIGGKTVTVGTIPDQYALKIKATLGETISFSASATAGAVYVAQNAGNPDPDGKADTKDSTEAAQFLKFQTDTVSVPAPLQRPGEANFVDGRIFGQTLGPEVKTVRETRVAADGSVYMLADVVEKTAGQALRGEQDVALLKYDAAGQLIFARTLGAADEATGLGLAIAADGKIAVAGSVKGVLNGAADGPLNSTGAFDGVTDSFVTLYDAEGQELWTQRRGARQADEASEVAFGADGTVYVSGRTTSTLPGAATIGEADAYLQAFKADAAGKVQTLFTTTFGTTGADRPAGLVVDGTSVITASVEDGRAVLRRYDVSGAAPVLTSTQDLGDLQGGQITGLALDGSDVVVAGSTGNPGLSGLSVTRAHAGGQDAFAARLSANLGGGGSVAYYGGAGDDRATSLAVAGGQVWIGGSAGTDLPNGLAPVGTKDGFLARLDVNAGTIDWARRFTGKDGRAAPTAIAVDTTGASVLDRIGLPKGELDLTDSARITAHSGLRAGDQFTVQTGLGIRGTVTIEDKDTLDTLAQKIRRASGFQAKVSIATSNGQRTLRIEPSTDRVTLEFTAGKADKDALELLGIPEGVVRKTRVVDGKTVPADGKSVIYGLGFDSALSLENDTERKHALAEIGAAMGKLRQVYIDLKAAASPPNPLAAAAASGPVPAYLTNQIANYQAALARLGG
ncbi:MAG: hypothetical protein JNK30_07985 [Phenylobacterium sp.]|uniref:hypothetical protein n=1 Tax=Phenylobacterium sp. TaxID=1871053 RepID=UPI001A597BD1|nr:hypothetical protein [Phenylobacterium sp.]MBL8771309.1 hypothetical protein [Phenylobacterium sp.]